MHLLPVQNRSLDDEAAAIDLDQSPAEILVLSFTDSDLAVVATAWEQSAGELPSLRLANLAKLKHPYSVDLFIEKTAAKARFILVRLLGGADYWRYGVDELAAAARRHNIRLAILSGDGFDDARLHTASTLPREQLETLSRYFEAGGVDNVALALLFIASQHGGTNAHAPAHAVPLAGLHRPSCRPGDAAAPHVLILFYRSALLAADIAPVSALADALAARGARVSSFFVSSLKDAAAAEALAAQLREDAVDAIVNTTAFSARGAGGCVTDQADVPVFQAIFSGADHARWVASQRGLGAADLAMNVVLPEVDGRLTAGVISFKMEAERRPDLEFSRVCHTPDNQHVAYAADFALNWAKLRRIPRRERRLACVLSDYPGKDGRAGHAVGLDTPASVVSVAHMLCKAGFDVAEIDEADELMRRLTADKPTRCLDLATYRSCFAALPKAFADAVEQAWGDPQTDEACLEGWFHFRIQRAGKLVVAVQPDRGSRHERRSDYHDTNRPPRHGYIAFYLWLRHAEHLHAMIHMGTHGTLEWLPGKAVALSAACAPRVLTGALPVIYPFIVNNPGEAAQAKRRIGALMIGHLTPPLIEAGLHGDTAELEHLFDEYAEALSLDPRRARLLATAILAKAEETGLLAQRPLAKSGDQDTALASLDAWLCDIKEARVADGLHVFGQSPEGSQIGLDPDLVAACGPSELNNLVAALDGRFVPPGPAGAPMRGRADVLPTGRNIFTVDPRGVPTRTAWEIGLRMAEELVERYAQDHGDWPRRIVLDLWGSATMRTGGDDLAQAFALIGAKPVWDHASTRVNGFEILPLAKLGRSRVDVTLRISGLFRDTFPDQIASFDAAVRAIAALDEEDADNPLAEARRASLALARVFGAAPGVYGVGIARALTDDDWGSQDDLGHLYLAATSHAYARDGAGTEAPDEFKARVATADAFSHTGDLPGQDVLDSDTFADHEGGFAAAAALLGGTPVLYRADTTELERPRLRTLSEDIQRALLSRATNPAWIAGQMRHGYQGAAVMADTLDALFGFAATTDAVPSSHFDRFFKATLGDDATRDFLCSANPGAATAMAAKFDAAITRGLWLCRRNSTHAILAEIRAVAP